MIDARSRLYRKIFCGYALVEGKPPRAATAPAARCGIRISYANELGPWLWLIGWPTRTAASIKASVKGFGWVLRETEKADLLVAAKP